MLPGCRARRAPGARLPAPINDRPQIGPAEGTDLAATSLTSGAAGRYSTALFELAREAGELDRAEADLNQLAEALETSPELNELIRNPVYTRAQQEKGMGAIADRMGLSPLVRNVVGLMAQKRRLFALPQMIAMFRALLAEHRGEVTAEVTAAHPLSDMQRDALAEKIKSSMGRDVKLSVRVDESIIGGLVVRVGSRMIDSSIRSKLARLQNAMKEVG
jgi:F-type H+-transporting ATPase subunit delta